MRFWDFAMRCKNGTRRRGPQFADLEKFSKECVPLREWLGTDKLFKMDHQIAGRDSKQETSHWKRSTKQAPHKSCVVPEGNTGYPERNERGLGKTNAAMNLMYVCGFWKPKKTFNLIFKAGGLLGGLGSMKQKAETFPNHKGLWKVAVSIQKKKTTLHIHHQHHHHLDSSSCPVHGRS